MKHKLPVWLCLLLAGAVQAAVVSVSLDRAGLHLLPFPMLVLFPVFFFPSQSSWSDERPLSLRPVVSIITPEGHVQKPKYSASNRPVRLWFTPYKGTLLGYLALWNCLST